MWHSIRYCKNVPLFALLAEAGNKGWCAIVVELFLVAGCSTLHQHIAQRTDELSEIEKRIHRLVNEYRRSQGVNTLVWNDIIAERALKHSEKMASNQVHFSHDGFDERMRAIAERMQVRNMSENLGYNWGREDPAAQFVDGWIKSPGHHANMIGDFELTGIGVAKSVDGTYYATQLFVLNR